MLDSLTTFRIYLKLMLEIKLGVCKLCKVQTCVGLVFKIIKFTHLYEIIILYQACTYPDVNMLE
jgi:hypothetical protein